MTKLSSTTLSYLVKATGDHYVRQVRYNKRWSKANPERRALTVNKYLQRKKEAEQARKARVAAYLNSLGNNNV